MQVSSVHSVAEFMFHAVRMKHKFCNWMNWTYLHLWGIWFICKWQAVSQHISHTVTFKPASHIIIH